MVTEVNTDRPREPGLVRFPGVKDHGMHDTVKTWQPGRSHVLFHGWEGAPPTEAREVALVGHGKSDRLILLLRAGNAVGGKEATHGRAS